MKFCLSCNTGFVSEGWQCPSCRWSPHMVHGRLAFSSDPEGEKLFPQEVFSQLARFEANNFWFQSRNRLILWALGRYFPKADNFLEIGCGTGFVLSSLKKEFPSLALSGSEIYASGLDYAAGRLEHASLFQMDARQIPFENEFHVIGAFDVLEHVQEDEQVLKQVYQALRPGGGLILTVPQHPWLWSRQDEIACHVRRYRARELKARVRSAGFELIRVTSFVSFLLPLMIISRFKNPGPRKEFDPMSELKLNPLANCVFEKIMDLEGVTISAGMSFPAGGSLLLVARKPFAQYE